MDTAFVYLVRMETQPIYKIGYSTSVPRRMSQFGVLLPFPYRLEFALRVGGARTAESSLHELFQHRRMNGEWFRLDDRDVSNIKWRLLSLQALDLILSLRRRFRDEEYANGIARLEQYGRAFQLAARRFHRRARAIDDSDSRLAPVVETEFVV